MMRALAAEFAKLRRSRMIVWTVVALLAYAAMSFAVAPGLGTEDSLESMREAGGVWAEAADAGVYDKTWEAALNQAPMLVSSGLILLLFSFVTASLFAREFKEGTASQMLTLPIERSRVALSKFAVLAVWMLVWDVLLFAVHAVDLALLGSEIGDLELSVLAASFGDTVLVTVMLYLSLSVFAWLALWRQNYLVPMLASIVVVGLGTTLITTDISPYFPWNMPIHVVGTSWMPIPPSELNVGSWAVLIGVFALGVIMTVRQLDRVEVVR